MKNSNNSFNSFDGERSKDKKYKAQIQIVFNAFKVKPMTMLEADLYTGIMRSNICWYIDDLLEQGKIAMTKKRKCSITGRIVKEFTTDTDLFPKSNQLTLF